MEFLSRDDVMRMGLVENMPTIGTKATFRKSSSKRGYSTSLIAAWLNSLGSLAGLKCELEAGSQ